MTVWTDVIGLRYSIPSLYARHSTPSLYTVTLCCHYIPSLYSIILWSDAHGVTVRVMVSSDSIE